MTYALHRYIVLHNSKYNVIKIGYCIVDVCKFMKAAPIDVVEHGVDFFPIRTLEIIHFTADMSDVLIS